MPIKLGAGASAGGAGAGWAVGTLPPLTISAGVSGFSSGAGLSSTGGFSATTDLAGAEAALADFVDAALGRELATLVEGALRFSAGVSEFSRVMSGCATGADVVAALVVVADGTLVGVAAPEVGAEATTGCDPDPEPLK